MQLQRQVNVGRVNSGSLHGRAGGADAVGEQATQRVLGVSLLGACSSKGCPTKSVENEDRYVHVSFSSFSVKSLLFWILFCGFGACIRARYALYSFKVRVLLLYMWFGVRLDVPPI